MTPTPPAEGTTGGRFRIDDRRRWMIAEYHPDAGDGSPSTAFRDPTPEEWAAARAVRAEGLREAAEAVVLAWEQPMREYWPLHLDAFSALNLHMKPPMDALRAALAEGAGSDGW
jgi:hypothetical protein